MSKQPGKREAAEPPDGPPSVSLAAHPRARAAMRRLRARVAIGAFLVVGYLAHRSGVPGPDLLARALLAGIAAFFVTWACGVAVYRQVVLAELRHAEDAWRARMADRGRS